MKLFFDTLTDAFRAAMERDILPTAMGTAELDGIMQAIKERAVFSARTTNAVYLEALRIRLGRMLEEGYEGDRAQIRLELKQILAELGYDPETGFPGDEDLDIPPARAGSLQDLSSDRRINLILDTQLEMMAGRGQQMRGQSAAALDLFPAWELVRVKSARVPRDWQERWGKAGGRQIRDEDNRVRLIAHKLDEVWSVLGDRALFRDALGVSHPPFAFSSGMAWQPIEADEWEQLKALNGIQKQEAKAAVPTVKASTLPPAQISTDGLSRETLAKLKEQLKNIEAKDGKLTLESIIGTPPPPPPPARLRRLNALGEALLSVSLLVEINGKNRAKRRAEERAKMPGQKCGDSWIAAGMECHAGKVKEAPKEMSRDKAVKLLSSDAEMTAEQMATAMKAAPDHHHAQRLGRWFGKGHKDINGNPKSKDSVELVKLLRRVKPEERTAPLFRGQRHDSEESLDAWIKDLQQKRRMTLEKPITASTNKAAVADAFARPGKFPVLWTVEKPTSARNIHPAAEALSSPTMHQEERAFLPGTQLELKDIHQQVRDGKQWTFIRLQESQPPTGTGS